MAEQSKTEQKIRLQYKNLLNDIDFDKLELGLNVPNIFNILSISKLEIRHSNFLAWMLDPNESHGLGKLFLIKFLRGISISEVKSNLNVFDINNYDYTNIEILREWKNIDLLIRFDKFVICIENKIDSQDHSKQLEKYRDIVNKEFKGLNKVFVYLTPYGDEPKAKTEIKYYALYSYENIIEHLEKILQTSKKSLDSAVSIYISDYLTTLKRELMKDDEMNMIANKLYKNHRDLLEFIFENKSDVATEIYKIFEKKIIETGWVMGSRNKGYARFTTPALEKITPRHGRGWPQKESFLFEIDFFWSKSHTANFKTVIAPSNEKYENKIPDLYTKIFKDIDGYKKARGGKWLVNFKHSWKFDTSKIIELDESKIEEKLNNEWTNITNIVQKIEKAILENSKEFEKYI